MSYLSGTHFGLPESVRVHRLANIATDRLECGENGRIDAFVTITGKVVLGDSVHIGTGVCIFGGEGVFVGDDTGISPGVKIYTSTDGNPQIPHESKSFPVTLGGKCLIGTNTVILPGSVVGDGARVGALSLVKGSVPDGWLYAGIPIKPIRAL